MLFVHFGLVLERMAAWWHYLSLSGGIFLFNLHITIFRSELRVEKTERVEKLEKSLLCPWAAHSPQSLDIMVFLCPCLLPPLACILNVRALLRKITH